MSQDVATRIAQRSVAGRRSVYAEEVRRLLAAGLEVMSRADGSATARVADIVAAAGLSNDAFYRHFSSKSGLIDALLEDGAEQLHGYLEHQMAKVTAPRAKIHTWVDGVLGQADAHVAQITRSVLVHASAGTSNTAAGRHFASGPLAALLAASFTELGSQEPDLHAALGAHAVLGLLSDHIWAETTPTGRQRTAVAEALIALTKAPA